MNDARISATDDRAPTLTMRCLVGGLVVAVSLSLGACSTVDDWIKADPAQPAGFLVDPAQMNPHPGESPFHYAAHSKSREAHQRAALKEELYVAPVNLAGLRSIQKPFTRTSYEATGEARPAEEMAKQIRLEFAQAFIDSDQPRYRVVRRPGANSVTLELALVELDPTSVSGNAARTAGNFLLSPLVGVVTTGTTSGSIAIEGKVVNSGTGEVVFQFADRESDKAALFSVKTFERYGFIDQIIEEWAQQFEAFTRTPTYRAVEDSSGFTLNPF